MKLYLVDQENVGGTGLEGLGNLTSNDHVVIFCNHIMKSVPFSTHVQIVNSKALVEYKVIERKGPNYLDFQLVTYLGYLIATKTYEEIIIVSKDKGYEAVVDFWRARNIKIHRQALVKEKDESYRQKIHALLKGKVKLAPGNYTGIYNAYTSCKDKLTFHERLVKLLGSTTGDEVYKLLKGIFSQSLLESKK